MIRERPLFGPGPSNPYPEATAALCRLLGHLDLLFLEVLDETCTMLRGAWGTTNEGTLPLGATGSSGVEAALVNTVAEGDVAVVAGNGLFGPRMCDVAERCRVRAVAVEHEWGTPVDIQRIPDAQPAPAVHETLGR